MTELDLCSLEGDAMLPFDVARARIAAALAPIGGAETVALGRALGRVLAVPIHAPRDMPHERNAAVDGYAFDSRAIDRQAPFRLRVAGISWAGKPFTGGLSAGECVRVFTGARVPDAADSVVMQEFVAADGEHATFPAGVPARRFVRAVGEDVKGGQCLFAAGHQLNAIDLGLLAAAGVCDVSITRPLRIAFFSTGDELTGLGQPLASGKIYDSNRYLLGASLSDPCFRAADLGVVGDDLPCLEAAMTDAAAHYDVLITTGGASVGDADLIARTLERLGTLHVRKIAMKPGKPLIFGTLGAAFFFGLPGNPVAVAVTLQHIVLPALRQLAGMPPARPLRFQATLAEALKKEPGRLEFQRGRLAQDASGEFVVSAGGGQGSHLLGAMSASNCYIVLPADCGGVGEGEKVWVEPFRLAL